MLVTLKGNDPSLRREIVVTGAGSAAWLGETAMAVRAPGTAGRGE